MNLSNDRWYDLLACSNLLWGLIAGLIFAEVFLFPKLPVGNLYVYGTVAIVILIAGLMTPIRRDK